MLVLGSRGFFVSASGACEPSVGWFSLASIEGFISMGQEKSPGSSHQIDVSSPAWNRFHPTLTNLKIDRA